MRRVLKYSRSTGFENVAAPSRLIPPASCVMLEASSEIIDLKSEFHEFATLTLSLIRSAPRFYSNPVSAFEVQQRWVRFTGLRVKVLGLELRVEALGLRLGLEVRVEVSLLRSQSGAHAASVRCIGLHAALSLLLQQGTAAKKQIREEAETEQYIQLAAEECRSGFSGTDKSRVYTANSSSSREQQQQTTAICFPSNSSSSSSSTCGAAAAAEAAATARVTLLLLDSQQQTQPGPAAAAAAAAVWGSCMS
ncbi:hypothetical protein ACSSS7_006801 [Eimeria intestinalis]